MLKKFLLPVSALLLTHAAAATLPNVNCAKGKDARCTFSESNAGKVGKGLPFDLGGFVVIGSGFVDDKENALYVPVEFGGQQDNQGVIFKVDLKTGNRTIVSGYDGEEWQGKGVDYVDARGQKATAYDLGRVEAVRPGPAGSLLALVDKGLQQRTEILKIDKKTGDRTLVWASKAADDAEKVRPDAITQIEKNRFNFGSDTLCRAADDRVGLKPAETFETDGKFIYLMMVNNPAGTGTGLLKVPVTGGKCTWVSGYYQNGENIAGSGPTVNTQSPLVFGSALVGGEFLAATGPNPSGNTLFGIQAANGTRRTVSLYNTQTPARSKGSGDASLGYMGRFAVSGSGLALTLRSDTRDEYFEPVLVDLKTGNRTKTDALGSLKDGRDGNANIVAAIPNTNQFIVAFDKALHVYDAKTRNSYVLSQ